MSAAERIARLGLGLGRGCARLLPRRLRRAIDDRVFGAVFQVTRVTNDHYGWRPEQGDGDPGGPDDPSGPEGEGA